MGLSGVGGGTDRGGSGGEVVVVDGQHFRVAVGVSGGVSVGLSDVGGMVVLTGGVRAVPVWLVHSTWRSRGWLL